MPIRVLMVCFSHREANFRLSLADPEAAQADIVRLRDDLEATIERNPGFRDALAPIANLTAPCPLAASMARAARLVGDVGPMAAVAGAVAATVANFAIARGETEVVIDNGGDLAVYAPRAVVIGVYGGPNSGLGDRLALRIEPRDRPVAVCASSSRMGHSLSFGDCDLAVVVGRDGAVADAAATSAANQVHNEADIQPTLERIAALPDIDGVLLARDGRVGVMGRTMPQLVRCRDDEVFCKITGDSAALSNLCQPEGARPKHLVTQKAASPQTEPI